MFKILALNKDIIRAKDMAQWTSICLAGTGHWVQAPAPKNTQSRAHGVIM